MLFGAAAMLKERRLTLLQTEVSPSLASDGATSYKTSIQWLAHLGFTCYDCRADAPPSASMHDFFAMLATRKRAVLGTNQGGIANIVCEARDDASHKQRDTYP